VIRSLVLRNALSAVLVVVAIAGIVVQIRLVREGHVDSNTRIVLVAYIVIALYALASIVVRLRAGSRKPPTPPGRGGRPNTRR